MHTSNTDHDETLKEQIELILSEYKIGFQVPPEMDINKHLDGFTQSIMQLIKEDRERVVKEARIDELKNIVSPARTNKQKHLGVAYLVEDRLAELSNPTQAKDKQ